MSSDELKLEENETGKTRGGRSLLKGALVTLLAIFLLGTGCGLYVAFKVRGALETGGYLEDWDPETDGELLANVSYGDENYKLLDLYFPKEIVPERSHGAVIFIHGGAWVGGSRAEQAGFAKRAAKSGYIAANIEYLLFDQDDADSYTIEKVLDNVDEAILKVKSIMAERGMKLDRVALCGHSAGGHISALYAYSRRDTAPVSIGFVMPRAAPVDFHMDAWEGIQKEKTIAMLVSAMTHTLVTPEELGNPDDETEALIERPSPVAYVKERPVPTLAAYGGKDSIVGSGHPRKLKEAFEEIGAKEISQVEIGDKTTPVFDFIDFPKSNHMLGRDPDSTMKLWGLFLSYADRYLANKNEEYNSMLEWGEAVENRGEEDKILGDPTPADPEKAKKRGKE